MLELQNLCFEVSGDAEKHKEIIKDINLTFGDHAFLTFYPNKGIIYIVAGKSAANVRLAQLDRAFGYGPKGRGFESPKSTKRSSKTLT